MNKQYIGIVVGVVCSLFVGIVISPYVQPKQIELVPWLIEDMGEYNGNIKLYVGQSEGIKTRIIEGIPPPMEILTYLGTTSLGDSYFKIYSRGVIDNTIVIHGINSFNIQPIGWGTYYIVNITAFGKNPSPWVEITISDRIYP